MRLRMFWLSLPPAQARLLGLPGDPHSPPPGITFGPIQEQVCSPRAVFSLSISAGKGAGHHQVLPVPGEARRLGVGAELRHHRAQQPLVQAALRRQRQLRPHVSPASSRLGPAAPARRPRAPLGGRGGRGPAGVAGVRCEGSLLTPSADCAGRWQLWHFHHHEEPSLCSRERFRSFPLRSLFLISTLSFLTF